jgi:hypothetical protein
MDGLPLPGDRLAAFVPERNEEPGQGDDDAVLLASWGAVLPSGASADIATESGQREAATEVIRIPEWWSVKEPAPSAEARSQRVFDEPGQPVWEVMIWEHGGEWQRSAVTALAIGGLYMACQSLPPSRTLDAGAARKPRDHRGGRK